MNDLKLYMVLIGCKPTARHTEQHDVFFGVAYSLKELIPSFLEFWPEGKKNLHLDAWREVKKVGNYKVTVALNSEQSLHDPEQGARLFFINLGGYKKDEFEEFHYKMLSAGNHKGEAVQESKKTAFYRHTGFKGATSHIDDKYGIDVDDIYEISDILSPLHKKQYSILLTPTDSQEEDEIHLGYFKMDKLDHL